MHVFNMICCIFFSEVKLSLEGALFCNAFRPRPFINKEKLKEFLCIFTRKFIIVILFLMRLRMAEVSDNPFSTSS